MTPHAEIQRQTPRAPHDGREFILPPANIVATENGYVVEVDMPGVGKEGLEITVEGNELTITGRRTSELPEHELCYCETAHADFRRVFELGPDVDTARISAQMQQGVLILRLPKSEKAKPKQIEITEA
ncbi:MAG TPA: Hsp20/alpha crystallin family protein [Clostridia bacterium]|nr:Hsp20/alpha crystallin family protein [Clostridia bacterium]